MNTMLPTKVKDRSKRYNLFIQNVQLVTGFRIKLHYVVLCWFQFMDDTSWRDQRFQTELEPPETNENISGPPEMREAEPGVGQELNMRRHSLCD